MSCCCAGDARDGYAAAIECSSVHDARPSCSTSGGHSRGAVLETETAAAAAVVPLVALKKSWYVLHERQLTGRR